MASSASVVGSGDINDHVPLQASPSKLKTFGFAIAIIAGIAGLAIAATGFAGYLRVGALSNLSQVDAMIMMAAGGGGGATLLIIGIVGLVKKRQAIPQTEPITQSEPIKSNETQKFYGPAAWNIWNAEVLDVVPEEPNVDLSKNDKILLYIPQRIKVNGEEKDLTLKVLKEISGYPFYYFDGTVEQKFGDSTSPGWVLLDKTEIPGSRGQSCETHKKMVEKRGCSLPTALEALTLSLMFFAFTGERLFGKEQAFIRCAEKFYGNTTVVVGCYGHDNLQVGGHSSEPHGTNYDVAICAQRNF